MSRWGVLGWERSGAVILRILLILLVLLMLLILLLVLVGLIFVPLAFHHVEGIFDMANDVA